MKTSTLVKQRDISDCGPACLASVAAYFGLAVPVSQIRSYAGTDRKGTTLRGLTEAASHLNFQARAVRVKNRIITGIPVPTIFLLILNSGLQHFVVLYGIEKKRICFMDPALGELVYLPTPEFETSWAGVILLLAPTRNFQSSQKREWVGFRFWQVIRPHRNMMIYALTCAGIYTLLGLSMSWYIQKIFDFGLPVGDRPLVNQLSLLMMILLFFRLLLGYFKSILNLRTGRRIDSRLIGGYYNHLLKLPQRFFDSMRAGEIMSRLNDAVRIRIFINDISLNLIVSVLTLLGCLMLMFFHFWKLALVFLTSIPLYWLIYRISNRLNAKWQRSIMETGAAMENHLIESIRGMTTIRRFSAGERFSFLMEKRLELLMQAIYTGSRSRIRLTQVTEGITGLIAICVVWAGSRLVIDRVLSPGELLSFYTLMAFFVGPVQTLIVANRSMQDALIAADRLFEIIDLEKEKEVKGKLSRFPSGDLIFHQVDFSYGSGKPVFSGLQLLFPQNRITGLIGESGSGKSTILSLAQGLYAPDSGQILIGQEDIRNIPMELLRKQIAAVPQHTDLFQGDFIFNITLGDPQPDVNRIQDICQRLGLDDQIRQLPDHYHTIIWEDGINLSGGQRQKIGIARALYANPSVLILDEATAALDSWSEKKAMDTIRWFHGFKKTIVIISHRPAFLNFCDSLIHLRGGEASVSGGDPVRSVGRRVFEDWSSNFA